MSSEYRKNRPRRDNLEDLRQQGHSSDVVLLAWALIEMNLNQATLAAYRLSTQDPRSKLVFEAETDLMLNLLRKLGHLDEDENRQIKEFRAERNRLFHKPKVLFVAHLSDSDKEGIMDLAMKATDASHALWDRASNALPLSPPVDPGLGKPAMVEPLRDANSIALDPVPFLRPGTDQRDKRLLTSAGAVMFG